MADRRPHSESTARSTRVGPRLCVACFAFVLLFAAPAWSGKLVQVRVGNHPTFTRVVFEFDAPSGYRIERRAAGEAENSIRVTLDAASRARRILSKSQGVEAIAVDAGSSRSVAHIVTRQSGLPIREMILTDPPRVVLDLMIPGAEAAAGSRVAKAKPRKAEPKARPAAKPEVRPAAEPEIRPEAKLAARPDAKPEVRPEPAVAPPEAVVVAEPEPEAQPREPEPEPEPEREAEAEAERASEPLIALPGLLVEGDAATAEPTAAIDADEAEAEAPLAVVDLGDLMGDSDASDADAIEADARSAVPEDSAAAEAAPAPGPAPHAERADAAAPIDWKWIGMIGAGALPLLLLVMLLIRSRRSKSGELDVAALAGEAGVDDGADQASHAGRIPEGGFAMDADLHAGQAPEEDFETAAVEAHDDENKPIESAGVATVATPGSFDPSHQKEDAMSMDNQDLPTSHTDSEAPTRMGIGAAAVGAEMDSSVAHLIRDFERRLAHVEARLDESNEARERLERQVEAQAEELRVQRAAIARTQRAVRSLNRPDEDQATEPALRDPATPTG